MHKKTISELLWDAWCVVSGIGIWPRFIEPSLLTQTTHYIPMSTLPQELDGLRVMQFSDLHWSKKFSPRLKQKLIRKINQLHADIIVFTGDFLVRSRLEDPTELKELLCSLKARVGHFAILGNHDYAQFVTVNLQGDYDIERDNSSSNISKGFKRLFSFTPLTKKRTLDVAKVSMHQELIALIQQTPFKILHNDSILISNGKSFLNICGVGEYSLGRSDFKHAFKAYDHQYPGLILVHNPDAISHLDTYPGDLILAGHTHGGQINLPWMWKQFTRIENLKYKKGLKQRGSKLIYINRGIGSVIPFRWFAPPEISLFILKKGHSHATL